MQTPNKKYDLEDRLIKFAILVVEICESLPNTKIGNHLSGQLIRSGTSSALHYGEVQSAESRKDFVHKVKVILKELRETSIALKLIIYKPLLEDLQMVQTALSEANELISIFVKSAKTARKNMIEGKS